MINVCYAISDERGVYSKFVGASICSIFENTSKPVTVHLLHDGSLSEDNKRRFERLVLQYDQKILFYEVPKLIEDTIAQGKEIFPIGLSSQRYTQVNMYRLAIAEVLPDLVERVIFLDADTIVNVDIDNVWQEEAGPAGLAAVSDWAVLEHFGKAGEIKENNSFLYRKGLATVKTVFNAGVLLLDLKILRQDENLLLRGLRFLAANDGQWDFYDNDILIAFFSKSFRHLPWNYNIRVIWARAFGENRLERGIYHYVGRSYGLNPSDSCYKLFISYLLKTPWIDESLLYTACHIARAYTMTQSRKRLAKVRQIANFSHQKKRVIMGLAGDEARLREDFALGEDEKFVTLTPGGKVPLLYSIADYYYLIFWSNYGEVKELLEKVGLREFEHFADGTLLMPEQTSELVLDELNFLWRI